MIQEKRNRMQRMNRDISAYEGQGPELTKLYEKKRMNGRSNTYMGLKLYNLIQSYQHASLNGITNHFILCLISVLYCWN